jgi:hypothetical protein
MKNRIARLSVLTLFVFGSVRGMAQRHRPQLPSNVLMADSMVSGKYSLIFASNYEGFDSLTRQNMINVFFTVYPEEVERFNKRSLTRIVFFIDTAYKGVAATGDGMARFNPAYMKTHPQDVDVVTHEVMHVVQDYKNYNPGWLTEGIADYVRYVYGVNNKNGGWTLPEYKPGQSYKNAYRVTARFLLWVEKNKYNKIVDDMDRAMREGKYTPELWKKLTGETVDELWDEYVKNPAIELSYK